MPVWKFSTYEIMISGNPFVLCPDARLLPEMLKIDTDIVLMFFFKRVQEDFTSIREYIKGCVSELDRARGREDVVVRRNACWAFHGLASVATTVQRGAERLNEAVQREHILADIVEREAAHH